MNLSIIETVLLLASYIVVMWGWFTFDAWKDRRAAKKKARDEFLALSFKEKMKRAGKSVQKTTKMRPVVQAAKDAAKTGAQAANTVVSGMASGVGGVAGKTVEVVGAVAIKTVDVAGGVASKAIDVAGGVANKAVDVAGKVVENKDVQKAAGEAVGAAKKGVKKAGDAVKETGNKIKGFFSNVEFSSEEEEKDE
jgi:hypothetical protein